MFYYCAAFSLNRLALRQPLLCHHAQGEPKNEAKDSKGRHLGFFGFKKGHPLCVAYEGDIECLADADEMHLLCDLFSIFNTERRPVDYRGPSMSVGSVIELQLPTGCEYYAVVAVGFFSVSSDMFSASEIIPSPAVWRRN
jgi:hypothetical protein